MTHTTFRNTSLVERYQAMGFRPSYSVTPAHHAAAEKLRDINPKLWRELITVPGAPNWLPPLIPSGKDWLYNVQNVVHLSFMALIADIWTQMLVSKRDAKEKPLYLFWDHEVPKPNPLSSLAWLLTCEIWPMPNHKEPDPTKLSSLFPPQSFILPQSTQYGHASTPPHGYAFGFIANGEGRSLSGLLNESMHRGDRENMALSPVRNPIHRPRHATCYGYHSGESTDMEWTNASRWPRTSTRWLDQNYGAHEVMESHVQHDQLKSLRRSVMSAISLIPGLVTHKDTLHHAPGMSIRHWSERSLYVKNPPTGYAMKWNAEGDSVKLEHGVTMTKVPHAAPRVWFGFTHFGPAINEVPAVPTASQDWARLYLEHRGHALRMLFKPESIDLMSMVEDHTVQRGLALSKAGRIKKATASTVSDAARAAFAALLGKD